MAASERQYIVKTVDGQEHGPVTQEALIRWAQNGRITAFCQVRSTLIKRWEYARDISFLAEIIASQEEPEQETNQSLLGRVRSRATMRAGKVKAKAGLQEQRAADYETAPAILRVAAGLTDVVVVGVLGVIVYLCMALLVSRGMNATVAFYVGFTIFYPLLVMYIAWSVCFRTQTLGQKWWGLLVVRRGEDETDVLLGRAFVYAMGVLLLGVLTPAACFVNPSGRALQDVISGTRVAKVRLVATKRR